MSEPLTESERYAIDYLYGGDDVEIECYSVAWVKTRYKQKCLSIVHEGAITLPASTRMVTERAKVEGKFGTCYTCAPCVRKIQKELERN